MVFLRRLIGAAMLDAGIYEEIENDRMATLQAGLVVILSSVAAGFGATGLYDPAETVRFSVLASAIALLAWASWAMLTLQIGSRILPTRETKADLGQLLRTLGFSASPGLLQVFAVLPGMVIPMFALSFVWTVAASVVAVRHALDYESTTRAFAVSALGWLLALIFVVVLGVLFGPSLS